MVVTFLSRGDAANLSYNLSESLKAVGVDSIALKLKPHKYKYDKEAIVTNYDTINRRVAKSDIIVFVHSQFLKHLDKKNLRGKKKKYVVHGGSTYRIDFKKINIFFNKFVDKTLIQTGDLLNLGGRNEVWIMAPIDTDYIQPINKEISDKIVISHFPSGELVKGSNVINSIMNKLMLDKTVSGKFIYNFSGQRVPWKKNLERMAECDIYLEACQPTLKKRRYGEFGIAGLEAAAQGKILITHFRSSDRYKQEFGEHPIQVVNTPEEIEQTIRRLLLLSKDELVDLQNKTRDWVVKYHSFKSMGERLKKVFDIK